MVRRDAGGFFVTNHEAYSPSMEYVTQIARIARVLAQRAREGEAVQTLVLDARLLYAGAWKLERQRRHHLSG